MATSGSEAVSVDWAKTEAQNGKVKLPLTGQASKHWAKEAASILERLDPTWPIEVKSKSIVVEAVARGQEGDVRHMIESVVLEANARLVAEDSDRDDARPDATDEEMTSAFRAFGRGM